MYVFYVMALWVVSPDDIFMLLHVCMEKNMFFSYVLSSELDDWKEM